MAQRPVFLPQSDGPQFVLERSFEFVWSPGMAPSQKKKNVAALHNAAKKAEVSPLLEVSTKSEEAIGHRLSAFNLSVELEEDYPIPLECAFQGSKVFANGGPFHDLYGKTSREAKKDSRLRSSGELVGFDFHGLAFPTVPKTAFYDWLYVRALLRLDTEVASRLSDFAGFTDIEFNPKKSINCQARSCALFVSLHRANLLPDATSSPEKFVATVSRDSLAQPHSAELRQGRFY